MMLCNLLCSAPSAKAFAFLCGFLAVLVASTAEEKPRRRRESQRTKPGISGRCKKTWLARYIRRKSGQASQQETCSGSVAVMFTRTTSPLVVLALCLGITL